MIRQANRFDKIEVINTMRLFKQESEIPFFQNMDNPEWWGKIFDSLIAGRGVIFIEEGKGLIMGMSIPSIWCDKTWVFHELAWYVKPEFRKTTVGYRLFKTFLDHGNKLKAEGKVHQIVMGKAHNSPTINYERYGFRKMEETWISSLQ